MVTIIQHVVYDGSQSHQRIFIYDVRCKSTDTKPTTDITNGSTLIEVDTGNIFIFDGESQTWNAM